MKQEEICQEQGVFTNTTLRNDLLKVYQELREDKINKAKAAELANVAGKILSSGKSQLEYNKWAKNCQKIEFFE